MPTICLTDDPHQSIIRRGVLDYTNCDPAIGLLGDIKAAKPRQNMEQKEVSRW